MKYKKVDNTWGMPCPESVYEEVSSTYGELLRDGGFRAWEDVDVKRLSYLFIVKDSIRRLDKKDDECYKALNEIVPYIDSIYGDVSHELDGVEIDF